LFDTKDATAVAALSIYNPLSIKEDLEYGGSVCKVYPGKYTFSIPNIGSATGVTPSECPTGTEQEALYHTHAGPAGNGEIFSPLDRRFANGLRTDPVSGATFMGKPMSLYLATPSGVIKRFDPNTRKDPYLGAGTPVIFKQRTPIK
jgi:hypothetical protein